MRYCSLLSLLSRPWLEVGGSLLPAPLGAEACFGAQAPRLPPMLKLRRTGRQAGRLRFEAMSKLTFVELIELIEFVELTKDS